MKRIIFILIISIFVCFNYGCANNNNKYLFEKNPDETYKIVKYYGNDEIVSIPEKYNGKKVSKIGAYAFANSTMKEVILKENITEIEVGAFYNCDKLIRFNSSEDFVAKIDTVDKLGAKVFEECNKVKIVKINNELCDLHKDFFENTYINGYDFNFSIGMDVTQVLDLSRGYNYFVKDNCFYFANSKFTSLYLSYYFNDEKDVNLDDLYDSESSVVEEVLAGAFIDSNIKSLTFSGRINENGLKGCDSLEVLSAYFYYPIGELLDVETSSLREIYCYSIIVPERCFLYLSSLEKIVFPNGVVQINDSAFSGAKKLRVIEGIEDVEMIGFNAFGGCESLEKIPVLKKLKSIKKWAFRWCANLKTFNSEENNVVYLPDGIEYGYGIFEYCKSLRKVIINASIEENARCFFSCDSLVDVVINSSINKLLNSVFRWGPNLKNIHIVNIPLEGAKELFPGRFDVYYMGTLEELYADENFNVLYEIDESVKIICTDGVFSLE